MFSCCLLQSYLVKMKAFLYKLFALSMTQDTTMVQNPTNCCRLSMWCELALMCFCSIVLVGQNLLDAAQNT